MSEWNAYISPPSFPGLAAMILACRTFQRLESPSGLPKLRPEEPLLVRTKDAQTTPSQCKKPPLHPRRIAVMDALSFEKP